MKRIYWLVVLAVSSALAGSSSVGRIQGADSELEQLVLSPSVADNVALFFSEFRTELVLCLEGEQHGNVLYVTDFRVPHILLSETGRVQAAGCKKGTGTVGTWHNHPTPGHKLAALSPESLARNCYLSRTDIRDFVRRTDAMVSVVSCGPRTYAYWWREDVEETDVDLALLPAPEGQLTRGEGTVERGSANLTQARSR